MLSIKMTPQELRDAATDLLSKKEDIVATIGEVKTKINEVTGNWEGASQSQFIETFNDTFLPMIEKDFPEILEGIGAQLGAAADAIEEADAQIASSFK